MPTFGAPFFNLANSAAHGSTPSIDPSEIEQGPTAVAPRTATAAELKAKIAQARGALTVKAYSSEWLLATNDWLNFSVERLQNGDYKITARPLETYALIGGAFLFIYLLTR
jgi:hypothetical protein